MLSEKKIINNIRKNYKKLTIIFITHRLNALKKCNKIIFIQNSKVKKIANYMTLAKEKKF